MKRRLGYLRTLFATALVALLPSCGTTEVCTDELTWKVTPMDIDLSVGESIRVTAEAFTCGGTEPLEEDMRWSSGDPHVVSVGETTGTVSAEAAGSTFVFGEDVGPYRIGPVEIPVIVRP
jgi:hypothetical protein